MQELTVVGLPTTEQQQAATQDSNCIIENKERQLQAQQYKKNRLPDAITPINTTLAS